MLRNPAPATLVHRETAAHHSRGAAWLLVAALVALGACGTVEPAPLSAKDDAGGNGAAGATGGATTNGAGGAAGEMGAAGAGGHAGGPAAAGSSGGSSSSGGAAGGTSSGGAGSGELGVSDVACPYDWSVQRGCPGVIIDGSPCNVCHDAGGTLLRCSTDPRAGARLFCVPDCAQCRR